MPCVHPSSLLHTHLCTPLPLPRACVKKFGRDIGLNIAAVRAYCIQMLIALKHLRNNGVLHADIKPDNILVNENRTVVKVRRAEDSIPSNGTIINPLQESNQCSVNRKIKLFVSPSLFHLPHSL